MVGGILDVSYDKASVRAGPGGREELPALMEQSAPDVDEGEDDDRGPDGGEH